METYAQVTNAQGGNLALLNPFCPGQNRGEVLLLLVVSSAQGPASSRRRARCNGAKVGEVEREPLIKIKSISNVYKNQTQIPSYFNVSCGDGVMENGVIY